MARPKNLVPTVDRHVSGQARVRVNGRCFYLGAYGSPQALAAYRRLLGELAAGSISPATPPGDCSIAELAETYLTHCRQAHSPSRCQAIGRAIAELLSGCAYLTVDQFGPLKLLSVRQRMIDAGLARTTINDRVDCLREMFRWAAEREIVSAGVHDQLCKVQRLRRGRGGVEPRTVAPVPWRSVRAVKAHVSPMVWRMVLVQWLTGMRSGELVSLTSGQLDLSDAVWVYRPVDSDGRPRDKGARLSTQTAPSGRAICIGRLAQRVLRPLLRADDPAAPLFSPAVSLADQRAAQRAARLAAGGGSGGSRKRPARRQASSRRPGSGYQVRSYRRAIWRACGKASIAPWHPHQLRHSFATRARHATDLEHAQAALGHAHARTAEIYALASARKAEQVARQIG